MLRILKYVIKDILNNKIVIAYAILLAVLSWSMFSLEDSSGKGVLSLLNIILLNVPLVSVIFSTIYIYNSGEFIELLLSQPIRRSKIWTSFYLGLCISLVVAFLLGAGIPVLVYSPDTTGLMMVLIGVLISAIFVSLAFFSSVFTRDKAKGIGFAIMLWLFFALLFDGIVLFLLFQFADYPIEKAMVGITALSPVDLSRIMVLLHLDVSAMLGYTGAIFKDFFGTSAGVLISFALLGLWVVLPFWFSLSRFRKMDL